MKIALFASGAVGHEVARFFGESGEPLACLALDSRDSGGMNARIVEASPLRGGAGPVFYSDALYEEATLDALRALDIDLVVLAWWPYIIRRELITLPRLGCLNFHPSYLPYNRRKNYNFWAIVEECPFGVTLHWVNERIDAGEIAFQSRIETTWEDTGRTLYERAQREIVRLFVEKYPEIKAGRIPRIPQEAGRGSFHLARELDEASRIELDEAYTARRLLNVLRARTFPPHPAAWFVEEGERYEVRIEIRKVGEERQGD